MIASVSTSSKIVVEKSTVPVKPPRPSRRQARLQHRNPPHLTGVHLHRPVWCWSALLRLCAGQSEVCCSPCQAGRLLARQCVCTQCRAWTGRREQHAQARCVLHRCSGGTARTPTCTLRS